MSQAMLCLCFIYFLWMALRCELVNSDAVSGVCFRL